MKDGKSIGFTKPKVLLAGKVLVLMIKNLALQSSFNLVFPFLANHFRLPILVSRCAATG